MTEELKAKLRGIVGDLIEGVDPGGSSDPSFSKEVDETVSQIDQAYKEAGYAIVKKHQWRDELGRVYTQHTITYPDGSGEFARTPQFAFMTGQKWYDKFVDVIDNDPDLWGSESLTKTRDPKDAAIAIYRTVKRAAKKAAGIE